MADIIQAKYEALEQVAARFERQAQASEQLRANVARSMDQLQSGWLGLGSEAFFDEMERLVMPALGRLIQALNEANHVTKQITTVLKNADEDAASPFKNGDNGGSSLNGGGASGGGTDGAGSDDGAATGSDSLWGDTLNQLLQDFGIGDSDGSDLPSDLNGDAAQNDMMVPQDWLEGVQDAAAQDAQGGASESESAEGGGGGGGGDSPKEESGGGGGGGGGQEQQSGGGGGGGQPSGGGGSGSGGGSPMGSSFPSGFGSMIGSDRAEVASQPPAFAYQSGGGSSAPGVSAPTSVSGAMESGASNVSKQAGFTMPIGLAAVGPLLAIVGKVIKDKVKGD